MNNNLTQIAIILDRSGSMHGSEVATVGALNEYINSQKKSPGETRVLFVQFDNEYERLYDKDIKEVRDLEFDDFQPRGTTALLDAIGKTVDDLGKNLRAMNEKDRPGRVQVVVLTDGFENASQHYTEVAIRNLIEQQQNKYNWNFIFLAANQDAILSGRRYGFYAANSLTLASIADPTRMLYVTNALNNATDTYKYTGSNLGSFTQEDRDLQTPTTTNTTTAQANTQANQNTGS